MSAVIRKYSPFDLFHELADRLANLFPREPISAEERHREAEIARAVDELSRYTDRELQDLGMARGEIEEAVCYGRCGIERSAH